MIWTLHSLLSLPLCSEDCELVAVGWLCCCFHASTYPLLSDQDALLMVFCKLALMSPLRSLSWPSQLEVGSLTLTAPHLCLCDNNHCFKLQFSTCLFSLLHSEYIKAEKWNVSDRHWASAVCQVLGEAVHTKRSNQYKHLTEVPPEVLLRVIGREAFHIGSRDT